MRNIILSKHIILFYIPEYYMQVATVLAYVVFICNTMKIFHLHIIIIIILHNYLII